MTEETLTKREKRLKALYQKEAEKARQMVGPDFDFEKMVRQDEKEETMLHEGADYDERDRDIVGFQTEKIENLNTKKKLSIKAKVEKELAYVTNAMGLDPGQ